MPTSWRHSPHCSTWNGSGYYTVRAYRRAAELIRATPADVSELVRAGRVRELAGTGPGIETRLRELVETGRMAEMDELRGPGAPRARRCRAPARPLAEADTGAWPRPRHPHARGAAGGGGRGTARQRAGDRAEDGGQDRVRARRAVGSAAAARHAVQPRSRARRRDRRRARRGACRRPGARDLSARFAAVVHSSGSGRPRCCRSSLPSSSGTRAAWPPSQARAT